MEALLLSTLTVALAEIGDKTQLLALLLAARYRKPWPIIFGILAATLVNHALVGLARRLAVGAWLPTGGAALGRGARASSPWPAWALVPDKLDEDAQPAARRAGGVFLATLVAFFLVEIGDKTQVATVVLAAR